MEGLAKIKEKILAEGKKESERLLASAQEEIDKIAEENSGEVSNTEAVLSQELQRELTLTKNSELAKARMDMRRDVLKRKDELIKETIAEVVENIRSSKSYENLLTQTIKRNASEFGDDVVITVASKYKSVASAGAKAAKLKAKIEADDNVDGIVIQDGAGKFVRESLDAIVERKSDEILSALVEAMS